ncbi:MAG: hypothetical protein WCY00_00665 [Candidatus Dojkabacteria bacterium]
MQMKSKGKFSGLLVLFLLLSVILLFGGIYLISKETEIEEPSLDTEVSLSEEKLAVLEDFYYTDFEDEQSVDWFSIVGPCHIKSFDTETGEIEVEECDVGEDGIYKLSEEFLIVCDHPSRVVNVENLYFQMKRDANYSELESMYDFTVEGLEVPNPLKYNLITESIGEHEIRLRILNEKNNLYVNLITFIVEDDSICRF